MQQSAKSHCIMMSEKSGGGLTGFLKWQLCNNVLFLGLGSVVVTQCFTCN